MSSRIINGLHFETKGFSWNIDERDRIFSPVGAVTFLDTMLGDVENGGHYGPLRARYPELLIHLRLYPEAGWGDPNYRPHWIELSPTKWARECRRRLSVIPGLLDDPNVILSFANEPDLAIEGHPAAAYPGHDNVSENTFREIWTWYTWLVEEWRALPSARCAIATVPLAAGHEPAGKPPDWEYTMAECKAMVDVCDVLNVHAYFLPDGTGATETQDGYWRGIRCLRPKGYRENVQGKPPVGGIPDPGGFCAQYPNKPFIVSEFGNFAHDQADDASVVRTMVGYHACYKAYSDSGRCLGVTPFLWNSSDEHKANRIRGNALLTQELQQMTRYAACEWPYKQQAEEETPVANYAYILGFADYAKAHPEVGLPTSDLMYDAHGNGFQYTENGRLEWNKQGNQTLFFVAVKAKGVII